MLKVNPIFTMIKNLEVFEREFLKHKMGFTKLSNARIKLSIQSFSHSAYQAGFVGPSLFLNTSPIL